MFVIPADEPRPRHDPGRRRDRDRSASPRTRRRRTLGLAYSEWWMSPGRADRVERGPRRRRRSTRRPPSPTRCSKSSARPSPTTDYERCRRATTRPRPRRSSPSRSSSSAPSTPTPATRCRSSRRSRPRPTVLGRPGVDPDGVLDTRAERAAGVHRDRPPAEEDAVPAGPQRGFVAPGVLLVAVLLYLPLLWTTVPQLHRVQRPRRPRLGRPRQLRRDVRRPGVPRLACCNTLLWVVGTLLVPVGLGLGIALLTWNLPGGTWLRLPFLHPVRALGDRRRRDLVVHPVQPTARSTRRSPCSGSATRRAGWSTPRSTRS